MTGAPLRALVIGEPLAELRPRPDGALDASFSGDALNVAVRLARAGGRVELATSVGIDHFSRGLLARLRSEGVSTRLVHRRDGGALGLYLVEVHDGERRFTYWRGESPARHLVDDLGIDALAAATDDADVVLVSGITLAVLDDRQRFTLVELLARASGRGTRVAFDPNVRPGLWGSSEQAGRWIDAAVRSASVVLASAEDLDLLDVAAPEWAETVPELVVTDGVRASWWWDGSSSGAVAVEAVTPLDTTGAGDAFDAAYLLARAGGAAVAAAVEAGHAAAAEAVGHPGGLPW